MAYDGIVNKSICSELKNIIGYKIDKISEPNKNTIILGLYKKASNFNLLACISANNYRIHLTANDFKNPNVAPNFCMLLRKHLIGFKIKDIYCKGLERITFIEFENKDNPNKPIFKKLIIELMGKHSNIILTDSNENIIDSIRHTSTLDNSLRDIYPNCKYFFPKSKKANLLVLNNGNDFFNKIEEPLTDAITQKINYLSTEKKENNQNSNFDLKISDIDIEDILSTVFTGISKSFISNIIKKYKNCNLSKDIFINIYNDINEIINCNTDNLFFIDIYQNNIKKDYCLTKSIDTKKYTLSKYLDDFYYFKEKDELFKNHRNNILNLILFTMKKYQKRLENMDIKLEECENMEKYKLYGELITANLYKISNQNISEIELENYYDNNNLVKIPLDKKYTPSYNAKKYFKKYNKLKNALKIVSKQKEETIDDINYIESIVYEIENIKTIEELEEIYLEISECPLFTEILKSKFNKNTFFKKRNNNKKKQKKLTTNKEVSFNPLKYKFEGYTILVGRNNKENDYLTLKYANKNDIWFHTKEIHGSHVILRIDNTNLKIPPKNVLYEAAKLATLHSKAKNSSNVPVDFCKVSFVKKPRGSKPGMVTYSSNTTIYVK